jgi:hypothetical protein
MLGARARRSVVTKAIIWRGSYAPFASHADVRPRMCWRCWVALVAGARRAVLKLRMSACVIVVDVGHIPGVGGACDRKGSAGEQGGWGQVHSLGIAGNRPNSKTQNI